MLETIDVLIGFAVVMLILSAIVTLLVQWIITTVINLKGRVLRQHVAHLLRLLDKHGLTDLETRQIADNILRDSLVARKKLIGRQRALASVIHREELVKLLLDFASRADLSQADDVAKQEPGDDPEVAELRKRLRKSLENNGLVDPGAVLTATRATMLALEQTHPEMANDARHNLALLNHASSEFLAKLHAWFDQTIDRTIEAFTARARLLTVAVAFLVAAFFQVDSFQLMQRLSQDDQVRTALVNAAITEPERFTRLVEEQQKEADRPAAGEGESVDAAKALAAIANDPELGSLVDTGLIEWPRDFDEWWQRMAAVHPTEKWTLYAFLTHLVGLLLSVGLLALGAPLWYEMLKNLVQLRSVVARKDDLERTVRQTSQEAPTRAS